MVASIRVCGVLEQQPIAAITLMGKSMTRQPGTHFLNSFSASKHSDACVVHVECTPSITSRILSSYNVPPISKNSSQPLSLDIAFALELPILTNREWSFSEATFNNLVSSTT